MGGEMMLSDTLSDAVAEIDSYLNDSYYDRWYEPRIRDRVISLRNEMNSIREALDSFLSGGQEEDA
jgi:hypothetical protein